MSKQDRQGVRTPADVERKYNLGQLAKSEGLSSKEREQINQLNQSFSQFVASTNAKIKELEDKYTPTKIETTQTWFGNGVPTLESPPALSWNTDELKVEHIGDIYYDVDNGYVYLFDGTGWIVCNAPTNAETFLVTFYDAHRVVQAGYTIKQGDSVNAPITDVTWVNDDGVAVTFPYTPTSDTNLYIQESTL